MVSTFLFVTLEDVMQKVEWVLFVSGAGFKVFDTLDDAFAEIKALDLQDPIAPLTFSVEKMYVEE